MISYHNCYTVPQNRTVPSTITIDVGTNIDILCLSSTEEVTWIFREGPFPDNLIIWHPENGANEHRLFIVNAQLSNEGTYICQGKDTDFDKYLFFSSTTTVKITKGNPAA